MIKYITFSICSCFFNLTCFAQICAHRGDVEVAPENTIPAFLSAVRKGAQQIEFDVALTKDGKLVVMHDSTVDRTTSGKGRVSDLTFDEIRLLDAGSWFDPKFKGTQVPTLHEALNSIPKSIYCNVHLKGGDELAQKSAKVIAEMGRLDTAFIACSLQSITAARKVIPKIKTCNMTRQAGDRLAYIRETIVKKCEFIQLHQNDGYKNIEAQVRQLHDAGVTINWFGANDPDLVKTLHKAGIDYILTDKLDMGMKITKKF
tara:strand:+ start:12208 stop:12984 length:777 start_codon:yes stop_codon:yes gene_type:complete